MKDALYKINDKDPQDLDSTTRTQTQIKNNMYCMNYIKQTEECLILYRKYILKFIGESYFIFEKKNKTNSKYYFRECISQIIEKENGVYDTIIDTRDLHYDRQYVLFNGMPSSPADFSLKNAKDTPDTNNWNTESDIKDVIVVDIHFIYNQMLILDENIMDQNSDKKDFALNKFYQKQDWIEKRYFNLIKYQFGGRIGSDQVMADKLIVKKNNIINDNSTIKFRKIAGKNILSNTKINNKDLELLLHFNNINELKIGTRIKINFEKYILDYIQNKKEAPANEPVIIKDKNTKSYEENDLILDKNTISYVSFNFLNIKNIKEYRNKMNYIADNIIHKYYKNEINSIDKIKFNLESLKIIQYDKLLRYNKGKNRLILDNKVITPQNIGTYYRDIKKLRESYMQFLEKILKYKKTLNENIENNNYSLNVTNNELLSVLNNNPFNTKSNFLAQITEIQKIESTNLYNSKSLSADQKLIGLKIKANSYKKSENNPLFVKFSTTMNIEGFSINPSNIYIIHHIHKENVKPDNIYLEKSLLENDNEGNNINLQIPKTNTQILDPVNLYDCTNSFRKETIGVSNLIEIISTNKFKVVFDNIPLEFKPLTLEDNNVTNNMYISRPTYVMLNFTKSNDKNNIKNDIYENVLYKVIDIKSTTSNSSAKLTLESLIDIDYSSGEIENNNIFKDILVSQFIDSKNYIENVYFKKVEIPKSQRELSSGPAFKFIIELKNQIINISPEITRMNIISDYKNTMNKIIDYIYKNESQRIHYEIPENIGIYKDTSSAVFSYKYKNELYISYEKRNNPVNLFKNYNSEYLCKKIYKGSDYTVNMNSLYYLDSYQEYYEYFKNLFKNILGLHDEINYECNEYYKSGSMLSNLKLPITFNKYVSFLNNYMLYYKTNIKIDDIDSKYLGKHIVINNTVCDNQLLNIQNSNRTNSRLYKTFLKDLIYKHEIGRQGFEYSDAKKICERIFTVYDKNCPQTNYKEQSSNLDDYNVEYYKNNKERDKCFTTLYNDEKEKNTYQFIAESKMLDPTEDNNEDNNFDVTKLREAANNIKKLKNSCGAKLTKENCNADPNCYYTSDKCETLIDSNLPKIYKSNGSGKVTENDLIGNIIDIHPGYKILSIDNTNPFSIIKINYDSNFPGTNYPDKCIFTKSINNSIPAYTELDLSDIVVDSSNKNIKFRIKDKDNNYIKITNTNTNMKVYFNGLLFKYKKNSDTLDLQAEIDYVINNLDSTTITKEFKHYGNYFSINFTADSMRENFKLMNKFKIMRTNNTDSSENYKDVITKIEKAGNLRFYPHRLAHLNEIKTATYYGADWDDIGWINDANPQLYNKSNLVKIKNNKVMWIDKEDKNAINKGVICYGRKLDQEKIGANEKNEMYNFQMEKIEQNIKDIQKYENVSNFNKQIYSRWNL